MPITYDDFVNAATQKGLLQEFSQYDLDTAQRYPEFGMSILGLKEDVHKATTPEAKLLANEMANQLRSSYGGYTGGPMGADYVSDGKIPNQIDSVLDQINSFGSFSFDQTAPTYTNNYAQQQQELLDAIINRPDFSWSKETDPQWSSYKKSYLREGDRATANALAQASAASGGRPSTAAVTAATQAGDYYATQLNDIIPTLYQQAYDRYLDEYNMSLQDLNAVNTQEQLDYAKYLDQLTQYNTDRNFAFNEYLTDFDILQSQLGALQGQDDIDYGRWMDRVGLYEQRRAEELEQQQQDQALAQAQVDAILSAGGSPSAELVGASGYDNEYVQALRQAYLQQQAARTATGGGSSGGGSSSSGGSSSGSSGAMDYDGLFAAALASGHPKSFIANNYKRYGFTSQTGLSDEYEDWALEQEETASGSGGFNGMRQDYFRTFAQALESRVSAGDTNGALGSLNSWWGELSADQQEQVRQMLAGYGLEYEP